MYLRNGKIYSIKSELTGEMYIGSTFRDLNIRLQEHQRAYKYFKADGYGDIMSSLIIIHTNNYDIHLLQHFNWISKKQLHDNN